MTVLAERSTNLLLDPDEEEEPTLFGQEEGMSKGRRSISVKKSRRRRRSSARFLRIEDRDDDEDEDNENAPPSSENLGQVYQQAIRLNAENRINASNSWNLSLIDHMDRFLIQGNSTPAAPRLEDTLGPTTGVNFTKASCTLDASVKIYSYRVDDVHLTSYKVLANLNRTDNGKSKGDSESDAQGATAAAASESRQKRTAAAATETLESNVANINIHKLDSAYDIDPLFHKMSKTFDEGGAKGLLLANLSVSPTGCNIVFDSTLDEGTEESPEEPQPPTPADVDVSTLQAKLEATLNGQTIQQLPLVPQLASLRQDYASLQEEGFVEKVVPSEHYAASNEEELEADRSIHVEAIERSRVSQGMGVSLMAEEHDDTSLGGDDDEGGFAPDDFGGDDNDDFGASFFHDGDHRFSSASFQTTFEAALPPSQTTVLLDAIAAGDIAGSQSTYEYFNKKAFETIHGNQWAGASHWKKMQPKRSKPTAGESQEESPGAAKQRKPRKNKKSSKTKAIVVDILKPVDVKELMRKTPKGKKGSNPLQLTKTAVAKAAKNDNLLPLDAGLKIETLTSLFLRPNTNILDFTAAKKAPPMRSVGFGGIETWGDADDNSYGGHDDDGPGFNFAADDDDGAQVSGEFVVPELEGIRKVEKVRVGYATVAKKVDVKRLKKDLWEELERTFAEREQSGDEEKATDDKGELNGENEEDDEEGEENELAKTQQPQGPLSFQDTVREMQTAQTQVDVTLPFYFICVLHLANEKGLALESMGLDDFRIHCPEPSL